MREKLGTVAFLEGSWLGEGVAHSTRLTARLDAHWAFDKTFLEVRERTYDAEGVQDHEDVAWYRYDSEDDQLKVLHLMAPAHVTDRIVVSLADDAATAIGEQLAEEHGGTPPEVEGFWWYGGPFAPRVRVVRIGDELRTAVIFPGDALPAVRIRYRRIEAGG